MGMARPIEAAPLHSAGVGELTEIVGDLARQVCRNYSLAPCILCGLEPRDSTHGDALSPPILRACTSARGLLCGSDFHVAMLRRRCRRAWGSASGGGWEAVPRG